MKCQGCGRLAPDWEPTCETEALCAHFGRCKACADEIIDGIMDLRREHAALLAAGVHPKMAQRIMLERVEARR